MSNESQGTDLWRVLSRPEFGLTMVISEAITDAPALDRGCIRSLRNSSPLLMFSDYGGAHKGARYEVFSYLVTTVAGFSSFNSRRTQIREAGLHRRRMSYKTLNDTVRLRSLPGYLEATDQLAGALFSFAVDKRAAHRLTEDYHAETVFGTLGPWASSSFGKLSKVAHLAAMVIEGTRADGQSLIWITDEDEIAPNATKHAEATRFIGHLLNHYCTGNMGHFRFGTTASDSGDLLIEDLAAVADLAAGGLQEILLRVGLPTNSRLPQRLIFVAEGVPPIKVRYIGQWLSDSSSALKKVNVVVDEGTGERTGECRVSRINVESLPGIL